MSEREEQALTPEEQIEELENEQVEVSEEEQVAAGEEEVQVPEGMMKTPHGMISIAALNDVKYRLQKKNVGEVRAIARAVGVHRPSDGVKERGIREIVKIATGETQPVPRSSRGAPPKNKEFDRDLVRDIKALADAANGRKPQIVIPGVGEDVENQAENACQGILRTDEKGLYLCVRGCVPSENDVLVHASTDIRFNVEAGDYIVGTSRVSKSIKSPVLQTVATVNGVFVSSLIRTDKSGDIPLFPRERLNIVADKSCLSARMADFFTPAGRGQRAIISGSHGTGKTTLLKETAKGILQNEQDIRVIILKLNSRPEEVHEFKEELKGALIFSTGFDIPASYNDEAAKNVGNFARKSAECGYNVALFVDGAECLERQSIIRLLSLAICPQEGTTITVFVYGGEDLVSCETVANLSIRLNADLADAWVYPAFDVLKSRTLKGDGLQTDLERESSLALRKTVRASGNAEEAVTAFKLFATNGELAEEYKNG